MGSKIDVVRAISLIAIKRALRLVTIFAVVVFGLLFLAIWMLAHFISSWWWLLLLLWLPVFGAVLALRRGAGFLARRFVWQQPLTSEQTTQLDQFVDKLQRIAETRGLGWGAFVFLNIRDLLFFRDFRSTKNLVNDSSSLKRDFAELEKLF